MRALLLAGFVLIAPMARAEPVVTFRNGGQPLYITPLPQGPSSGQVMVSSGSGTLTWASPAPPKTKGLNTMEAIGFIFSILLGAGIVVGVMILINSVCHAHTRATNLENRVAKLDGMVDATDTEIQRVAKALSTKSVDDAKAAIIAMRST